MHNHTDWLAHLTEPQRHAVTHINGPLLVLAGPGSGKTRVITHRVAYMIQQGIIPWRILAITFTNKAAQEMRDRLAKMGLPKGSTICTFHSLAARLLREFSDIAGLPPGFSIYDDADQKAAMREALKRCELDSKTYPPARLLNRISNYKNDIKLPEDIEYEQFDLHAKITKRVYKVYQEILEANGAVDFDDLLIKLALLLKNDPPLRQQLNDRYQYVMVDEYQDTNHCQYQIARGLSLSHSNLMATGDPDQSIYGWRGADIGNILAFEEDYPMVKIVKLEENFRSTPEVLSIADRVIRHNTRRKEKKLFTAKASGSPCRLVVCEDEYEEARHMVGWIRQQRMNNIDYRDIAVFYRVNSMSRVLEETLLKAQIPYQIVRGVEFFKRKEIKDMLAYLRLLANPSDQVAVKRVINTPTRGIGNTTVTRLFDYQEQTGVELWEILRNPSPVSSLGAAASTKVKKFAALIEDLLQHINGPVAAMMEKVYEKSGLAALHAAEKDEDATANVKELISSAAMYDQQSEEPLLEEYLQQIALISDADAYDEQAGAVSLMTLHAAKGLEFPAVLITGVEDGLIPHSRNANDPDHIEEERRLLFVGMTRAQDELVMSHARQRFLQGSRQLCILSEFLRGIDGLAGSPFNDEDESFDPHDDDDVEDAYTYDESDSQINMSACLTAGQLVRSPKLGLGRIQQIVPIRDNPKVVVQFNTAGRKTLYLKHAKLEIVEP